MKQELQSCLHCHNLAPLIFYSVDSSNRIICLLDAPSVMNTTWCLFTVEELFALSRCRLYKGIISYILWRHCIHVGCIIRGVFFPTELNNTQRLSRILYNKLKGAIMVLLLTQFNQTDNLHLLTESGFLGRWRKYFVIIDQTQ